MADWRIYYDDGSTFSVDDGEVWESPGWGAVLITQDVADQDTVNAAEITTLDLGLPYFVHRADEQMWYNVDGPGLLDQLVHFGHLVDCVRPGRWMPTAAWKAVCARADADRGRR